ncbi:MAG: hypothetical protein CVU68_00580 [Deltaproteobacteria bacterium HGW-Deltaproteobacteria-3]|nr:MAG: hypothetical protein CVU68_00580 [Deltaproteobacteria bacterium HGW-Deltaproteobacteria-3]
MRSGMHIKFTAGRGQGKGSGRGVAKYLTGAKDWKGRTRPAIEVLRGDPFLVASVADSLDFKYKYTSGVITFAPEDAPSHEEINEVLDEFERTAWSGLDPDQYIWSAVLHLEEGGGCHIHIFTPRVDLRTGKSLNIAPPGRKGPEGFKPNPLFDSLRDYFNYREGWARPDDPARSRLLQPGHRKFLNISRLAAEQNPRQMITDYLVHCIDLGEVTDRAGIVTALKAAGFEIPRQGKGYLTVHDLTSGQRWRLKGAIYEEHFDVGQLAETPPAKAEGETRADRVPDPARAGAAWGELTRRRESRAAYHRKRYAEAHRADEPIPAKKPGPDRETNWDSANLPTEDMAQASPDRPEPLSRHLIRELGPDAVSGGPHPEPSRDAIPTPAPDRAGATGSSTASERILGGDLAPGQTGEIRGAAGGHSTKSLLERGRKTCLDAFQRVRATYDRIRATVDHRIDQAITAILAGTTTAGRTYHSLVAAGGAAHQASLHLGALLQAADRTLERGMGELIMYRDNELEQFKGKINLVEFAQSLGYQVDRRESSRNSKVMRHDNGDKIVVATGQNGHGIYFSVRDDRDNGSIIDFVQKRTGASLGQTRKALRPWIDGAEVSPQQQRHPEPKPVPTSRDRQQVILAYAKTEPVQHHAYLASRGIEDSTLADPRFVGMVRQDTRGNAIFPHHDSEGLAGYELKNNGFTGFARGGTKAIWHSNNLAIAKRVVIVESAIDGLSHAQLHKNPDSAYVSIGGQMSEHQQTLLRRVFERATNREAEIVIATDNDPGGDSLAGEIQKLIPAHGQFLRSVPAKKDWNAELQHKQCSREKTALPYPHS